MDLTIPKIAGGLAFLYAINSVLYAIFAGYLGLIASVGLFLAIVLIFIFAYQFSVILRKLEKLSAKYDELRRSRMAEAVRPDVETARKEIRDSAKEKDVTQRIVTSNLAMKLKELTSSDSSRAIRIASSILRETLKATQFVFYVWEPAEEAFVYLDGEGIDAQDIPALRVVPGDESFAGWVAKSGMQINRETAAADPATTGLADRGYFRSTVTVPVISRGKVTGIIDIGEKKDDSDLKTDTTIVALIANILALVDGNFRNNEHPGTVEKRKTENGEDGLLKERMKPEIANQLAGRSSGFVDPAGEGFNATVLYAEFDGFSDPSIINPRAKCELMNRLYQRTGDVVVRYNGIVIQTGDEHLSTIFGAPIPGPESTLDAVRAAGSMLEEVESVRGKSSVSVRIGIATGSFVIGKMGYGGKKEYSVISEALESARMLARKAGKGEVIIDDSTKREIGSSMVFAPVEEGIFRMIKSDGVNIL